MKEGRKPGLLALTDKSLSMDKPKEKILIKEIKINKDYTFKY